MDTHLLPPTPPRKRRTWRSHAARFFACLGIIAALGGSAIALLNTYPKHQLTADPTALTDEGVAINILGRHWQEGLFAWMDVETEAGARSVTIYVLPGHDQQPRPADRATSTQTPVDAHGSFAQLIAAHDLPPGPYTVYVVSETGARAAASTNITIQ